MQAIAVVKGASMVMNKKIDEIESVLEAFKTDQNSDPSSLLWFRSNADIALMLLAWNKVSVRLLINSKSRPKRLDDQWVWLWQNYSFSVVDWCDLGGIVDYRYGARLVARIMRLQLVFPDGTLAKWVTQYITVSAIHEVDKKTPKKEAPPPPKHSEDFAPPELEDDNE